MSIEQLLADNTAALERNTAALLASQGGAAGETKAPAKTETKAPAKTETKAPAKTETKAPAKAGKAPAKNKTNVSVEDAAATAASFLGIDNETERNARREWVVKLVNALGYPKVREISDADDRADFVRLVEQATETIEDGVVTDYPVIESSEAEDEV